MTARLDYRQILWASLILATLILIIRSDLEQLRWAEDLSLQGSPPPALDSESPTGYELGQRHFLGVRNRGETYRWIAYAQDLVANGFFSSERYIADSPPDGRPQLLPKLHATWLAAIAFILHLFTGQTLAVSVETAALWEPLIAHASAFVGVVAFASRRFGLAAGAIAGTCFALFPPLTAQFIPGALDAKTWALLLAGLAIASALPFGSARRVLSRPILSAAAASLALWLDPATGFPAALICGAIGACGIAATGPRIPLLRWAIVGSAISVAAWLIDQNPLALEPSELRYIHPFYALAWLGIGLALDAFQRRRRRATWSKARIALVALAILLIAPLFYSQIATGYRGWLYSSASMMRLSSIDETVVFTSLFKWLSDAAAVEIALLLAPAALALAAVVFAFFREKGSASSHRESLAFAIAISAAILMVFLRVRWGVVASLLAFPLIWEIVHRESFSIAKPIRFGIGLAALGSLVLFAKLLPVSLQRPATLAELLPADGEALVNRHFSHWMARQNGDRDTRALANPELSDSLIFHGGSRALMSTAWESHAGPVAASRVLSAPENTEAEAVLQSLEITHLAITSWGKVLPLLVQKPQGQDADTFYDRLQRWLLPLYLRPQPYLLPELPGYLDQKLAVFEVTPPQDGALSLSWLAEYFTEVNRPEPAQLAAKALEESFPNDPNSILARAYVHANAGETRRFEPLFARILQDLHAGRVPANWDRRALRAILLALGQRHDLARSEVAACIDTMTKSGLQQLSPLQTYQFTKLARAYKLTFPSEALAALAIARSREYH